MESFLEKLQEDFSIQVEKMGQARKAVLRQYKRNEIFKNNIIHDNITARQKQLARIALLYPLSSK